MLGSKVVAIRPSSGLSRAAARKVSTFFARYSTPLSPRSSKTNVTPPATPRPGIAGGEKKKAPIAALHAAQQAEAGNRRRVPHTVGLRQDSLDFAADRVGTLEGGCIGQL